MLRQRSSCFEIPHWRIAEHVHPERIRYRENNMKTPPIPKWVLVAEAVAVCVLLFMLAINQALTLLSAADSTSVLVGIMLMLALLAIYGVIATRLYHAFVTPAKPKGEL